MSNSNSRNPKELRDMIEQSKLSPKGEGDAAADLASIDISLQKLRHIPDEEKTESGMLRARIDEQSRLIMILKQRGDDYIVKNMTLERCNKELAEANERFASQLVQLESKCELLNKRFEDLAENHQELIKIKDEYKGKNALLSVENQRLAKMLSEKARDVEHQRERVKMSERIAELQQANKDYATLVSNLNELAEAKAKQALDELNKLKKETSSEINDLTSKLTSSEVKVKELYSLLADFGVKLKAKEAQFELDTKKLREERNELLEHNLQRGKQLQEKQNELRTLHDTCDDMDKRLKALKEQYEHDVKKMSENVQIQKLKAELNEAAKKYRDLQDEMESFKKYSNEQLKRERELNSKLNFYVSN